MFGYRVARRCARRVAPLVVVAFTCSTVTSPLSHATAPYGGIPGPTKKLNNPQSPLKSVPSVKVQTPVHDRVGKTLGQRIQLDTLLDEVGRLTHPVATGTVRTWKQELTARHTSAARRAKLNVWLGEVELAVNQEPERAIKYLRAAQKLVPRSSRLYGLAKCDTAVALWYEGDYEGAATAFRRALSLKSGAQGFTHRTCALWLRHASACAGYHAQHLKMGIPQPKRLDPLCGVAGLAVCLKGLGLPFGESAVKPVCRFTGEGSSMQDIVNASKALGLNGRVIQADDKGLQELPMPMVAYVEHDHFVAIVKATRRGVSYVCSDCGSWPGGQVDLTWKQWHALDPGVYLAVTRHGSSDDRLLAALLDNKKQTSATPATIRIAASSLRNLHLQTTRQMLTQLPLLKGHVTLWIPLPSQLVCGSKPNSQHCHRCYIPCPLDGPPVGAGGPSSGDPVNLATGEEEYTPSIDISVYNPSGPRVVWKRLHNTLRGPEGAYESDDLGVGWSHAYNVGVYDPSARLNPGAVQGSTSSVVSSGNEAPPTGLTWDVTLNGTTIATSSAMNGWSMGMSMQTGTFTVTSPASANLSLNYKFRYRMSYYSFSGLFDVVTAGSVSQGAATVIGATGTNPPATGLTWDVRLGGTTIATSTHPRGWSVSYNPTQSGGSLTVTPPLKAAVGSGYEARYNTNYYYGSFSGPFVVTADRFQPLAGDKYVVLENGARILFTAPTVPTSGQPVIACSTQAGFPVLVKWNYDSSSL